MPSNVCAAGRYLGLTEPTIIAAESPNPICNELVILPDMEKRLEAFVRMAHTIIVFPGGVGTAEEILYLLGILLSPTNAQENLPLVFTGPASSKRYFERLHAFIGATLGPVAQRRYTVILGDPGAVAAEVTNGLEARARSSRRRTTTPISSTGRSTSASSSRNRSRRLTSRCARSS